MSDLFQGRGNILLLFMSIKKQVFYIIHVVDRLQLSLLLICHTAEIPADPEEIEDKANNFKYKGIIQRAFDLVRILKHNIFWHGQRNPPLIDIHRFVAEIQILPNRRRNKDHIPVFSINQSLLQLFLVISRRHFTLAQSPYISRLAGMPCIDQEIPRLSINNINSRISVIRLVRNTVRQRTQLYHTIEHSNRFIVLLYWHIMPDNILLVSSQIRLPV